MELIREWKGRSEELKESVMVQMFTSRNEFGRIRKTVRVTLIFEVTGQEFFKDYLCEGWKSARHEVTQAVSTTNGRATANPARNTSPVEVAEPAYINEVSKALKGGYKKVYSSLDSLRRERENTVQNSTQNSTTPYRNSIPDRNTMPKKVSILTKGSVSLDTMRAWKREMDYVYAGGEFA